jgi:cytochrome c peroxidase
MLAAAFLGDSNSNVRVDQAGAEESTLVRVPRGLPLAEVPEDNPLTAAKVALGKQLYFDKRLSVDNTVSCASCHDPRKGWSDGVPASAGVRGRRGRRNSPSVLNTAYQAFQFWDGRASTLEEQALVPITNPIEMGMPSLQAIEQKLNAVAGYEKQFREVFGATVKAENVARAIAAFERTILAGEAPYDRFRAGDKLALSESAQRGLKLFFRKAHCAACHVGPTFTDNAFHNIGVGMQSPDPDRGHHAVSKLLGDLGTFKTPSLRDVARTAPYMHDGSLKTLDRVVDFYNGGGFKNPQLDEEIYPLKLTGREKQDLITFLKEGLTSDAYPEPAPPPLPE